LQVETRDPKTGDLIRINADDDEITLGEMLRQERFKSGPADQKNLDEEFARAITTDATFAVREECCMDDIRRFNFL
jgi:hypothetical protein